MQYYHLFIRLHVLSGCPFAEKKVIQIIIGNWVLYLWAFFFFLLFFFCLLVSAVQHHQVIFNDSLRHLSPIPSRHFPHNSTHFFAPFTNLVVRIFSEISSNSLICWVLLPHLHVDYCGWIEKWGGFLWLVLRARSTAASTAGPILLSVRTSSLRLFFSS